MNVADLGGGFEPATSWSPVGRRIQLRHRGRLQNVLKSAIEESLNPYNLFF